MCDVCSTLNYCGHLARAPSLHLPSPPLRNDHWFAGFPPQPENTFVCGVKQGQTSKGIKYFHSCELRTLWCMWLAFAVNINRMSVTIKHFKIFEKALWESHECWSRCFGMALNFQQWDTQRALTTSEVLSSSSAASALWRLVSSMAARVW